MTKYRILGIAPYEGFKGYFIHAAEQHEEFETSVYSAKLEQAVELLGTLDMSVYDVIVCRGRTGKMVAEATDVPVVNVNFSGYDILRSLKLAQYSLYNKIALVSYFDTRNQVEFLSELLDYQKEIEVPPPYNTVSDMEKLIDNLYSEGYRLFIGDGACVDYAKTVGAETILITSGPESMTEALEVALMLCRVKKTVSDKHTFFHDALEYSQIPVAIFDNTQKLVYSNLFSQGLAYLHERLRKYVPKVIEKRSMKTVFNSGKQTYRIQSKTFNAGNCDYVIFHIKESFQSSDKGKGSFEIIDEQTAKAALAIISNSSSLAALWSKLEVFKLNRLPVTIYGEISSGKTTLALAIYAISDIKENPFVHIDCGNLDEKEIIRLFEDERSLFYENDYTIYFNKINLLPVSLQNKFTHYLISSSLATRNRIISSFVGDPIVALANAELSKDLYRILAGYPVHIPSLNERSDDLISIARTYLNQINQELPIQIVGFEPDAIEILKQFNWEYGIYQFKQALEKIVLDTKGQFITTESVKQILSRMEVDKTVNKNNYEIDISKKLHEICDSVIDIVLKEENMNQSKAAQRLGISRSTLWKRLSKR